MPFNGTGTFTPHSPEYPFIAGTTIRAADWNTVVSDIATGLSNTLCRDGQSAPVADITWGGKKIINLADGVASGDAVNFGQLSARTPIASDSAVSFRNKVRNGKMEIAQRGQTFAGLAAPCNPYTLDGWVYFASGSTAVATISLQADAPADNEFQNSLRVAVTTADAAAAAADVVMVLQQIEGYLVRDLIGKPIAIKFRVRSSKTGVHCVSLRNSVNDRSYVMEYTVNVANTWETKTVSLPTGLITAGTWNWGSGIGTTLAFTLMAGSDFQTLKDAWQVGNFVATANQVNCLDTIGNIFAVTGVGAEQGTSAGPYEHRDPAAEWNFNLRYLEVPGANFTLCGYAASTTVARGAISYAHKRATPTITITAASMSINHTGGGASVPSSAAAAANPDRSGIDLTMGVATFTAGQGVVMGAAANAIIISAEL